MIIEYLIQEVPNPKKDSRKILGKKRSKKIEPLKSALDSFKLNSYSDFDINFGWPFNLPEFLDHFRKPNDELTDLSDYSLLNIGWRIFACKSWTKLF